MSLNREVSVRTVVGSLISVLLCVVWSAPAVCQQQASQSVVQQNEPQQELVRLRLERQLMDQLAAYRTEIDGKIASELEGHRKYLQELDDKLYERARFWIPIFSAVVTVLVAAFLWYVGRTQKEAFETAQLIAVSKATELAQQKVDQIVIPDAILTQIRELSNDAIQQAKILRDALVDDVQGELTQARDEIVSNKHAIIESTLNEAIKTKFSSEFNVMERLTKLETTINDIVKRTETVEQLFKVEAVRAAVVRAGGFELSIDLPGSVRAISKIAQMLTKVVLQIR
jgi:hypothetical protein